MIRLGTFPLLGDTFCIGQRIESNFILEIDREHNKCCHVTHLDEKLDRFYETGVPSF